MFQSTHPRGVRRQSISVYVSVMSFNPRTHVGCDENPWVCPRDKTFQSTHPRGVRLLPLLILPRSASFNPRTHVGCDSKLNQLSSQLQVSIHAPTWGATCRNQRNWNHYSFNPRTHVGCDFLVVVVVSVVIVSIHAPTWGATLGACDC